MKKMLLLLALLFAPAVALAQLNPGDFAIIGTNFDGNDEWSIVALTDIPAGTEVKFTDNGWQSSGSFRANEGTMTFTFATELTAGSVLLIDAVGPNLSGGGDQILAYQGSDASPTFIYALNNEGSAWQGDATSSNTSALPAGLVDGTTAVAVVEIDNVVYGGITTGSRAELLAAIGDPANWSGSNSTRQNLEIGPFTVDGNTGGPGSDTFVSFTETVNTTMENAGTQLIQLSITNPSAINATSVDIVVTENGDGGAADMTASTFTATFPAGSSADLFFPVGILNDAISESIEDVTLELQNATGGTNAAVGAVNSFDLLIVDDEAAQSVISAGQSGAGLIATLKADFKPSSVLSESTSKDVLYSEVFAFKSYLVGVYSGHTIIRNLGADPSQDAFAKDINLEHSWPKFYGAGSGNPLRDMHHLMPTRVQVNSDRGHLDFGEVSDGASADWYRRANKDASPVLAPFTDEYAERGEGVFEPREDFKGNIARAMFYFRTMYDSEAGSSGLAYFDRMMPMLLTWHYNDPVDGWEVTRTNTIAGHQSGKVNPFVVDSTLARRAFDPDFGLPIELASFTAKINNGSVELNWMTASELNNKGFEIERAAANGDFARIAFVDGQGTTTRATNYRFVDTDAAGEMRYRLRQVDLNGAASYSEVLTVEVNPSTFALSPAYPNPFNPSTALNFTVPNSSKVNIAVYDMLGREVAVLVNGQIEAGVHNVSWNASEVGSGIYMVRMVTADNVFTQRVVLVK